MRPCYGFVVLGAFAGYKKAAIIGGSAWFEINPINRLCDSFDTLVFNDGKQFQRCAAWLFNAPLPC